MLGWLRRRQRARRQPTPEQAFDQLSEAKCMYAGISPCSGKALSTGLRHDYDDAAVLVCAGHSGRLRKLSAQDADTLERQLRRAFAGARGVANLGVTGNASLVDSG
jgi:hypothetical protein